MDSVQQREDFLTRQRRREAARDGFVPAWRRRALAGEKYGKDSEGQPVILVTVEAAR